LLKATAPLIAGGLNFNPLSPIGYGVGEGIRRVVLWKKRVCEGLTLKKRTALWHAPKRKGYLKACYGLKEKGRAERKERVSLGKC
jgi:hypothetical protein